MDGCGNTDSGFRATGSIPTSSRAHHLAVDDNQDPSADLTLTELVIARGDAINAQHHGVKQGCITLLALQAPAVTTLRPVSRLPPTG
ncbi:MAG: hypothetical protein ACT4NP_13470 [Pseudonocardiales bacterium]